MTKRAEPCSACGRCRRPCRIPAGEDGAGSPCHSTCWTSKGTPNRCRCRCAGKGHGGERRKLERRQVRQQEATAKRRAKHWQAPTHADELLVAVAKLGGLTPAAAATVWGRAELPRLRKIRVGIRPLISESRGLTTDGMAEALREIGFPVAVSTGDAGRSIEDLLEDRIHGGRPLYASGGEDAYDAELRAMYEDLAAQEAEHGAAAAAGLTNPATMTRTAAGRRRLAAGAFAQFHGIAPRTVRKWDGPDAISLGRLIELRLRDGRRLRFGPRAMIAATVDGRRLFVLGKPASAVGDGDLGALAHVIYRPRHGQRTGDWIHRFEGCRLVSKGGKLTIRQGARTRVSWRRGILH